MSENDHEIDTEAQRQAHVFRAERKRTRTKGDQWILLVKELRVLHGVSILDAERIALSNPHRRRWVEMIVNTRQGRRAAISHLKANGENSLLHEKDGRFIIDVASGDSLPAA